MKPIDRILLTGAAGGLGTVLRPALAEHCSHLRLSDIAPMSAATDQEEIGQCDLTDATAILELTKGVDAVVYMAGLGKEGLFQTILEGHMIGLYNVYESARKNGVRRIVWASSNHAVGFYPFSQVLDASVRPRPDSNYGCAKVYGEGLAQYYWDKFRIESVSLRIGSCYPEPIDRRMLSTWLSYRDLKHLVGCCLTATRVDHTIVYGVSNNRTRIWDNRLAANLGYQPVDDAEDFRKTVEATTEPYAPGDPAIATHGGRFSAAGHFED